MVARSRGGYRHRRRSIELVKDGRLTPIHLRRCVRFSMYEIEQYVESLRRAAEPAWSDTDAGEEATVLLDRARQHAEVHDGAHRLVDEVDHLAHRWRQRRAGNHHLTWV